MGRRKLGTYGRKSGEQATLDKVMEFISIGTKHCENEHRRAEENAKFERGQQWAEGDAQRQKEREKPALPLNSMHKLLNAVANREIMDRFKPKAFSRGREDGAIAELLDAAANWQRDTSETEHEETIAFRRMCASGYGVMHKWWDPSALDGDGMLVDEEVPLWNMLWDPSARRQNLVDRRWHVHGKFIDIDDVEAIFGSTPETRARLSGIRNSFSRDDEHYGGEGTQPSAPGGTWGQVQGGKWLSLTGRELFVIEAEWKERKTFYKVAYPVQLDAFAAMVSGEEGATVVEPMSGAPVSLVQYQELPIEQQEQFMQLILSQTEIKKYDSIEEFRPMMDIYESVTGMKFEDYAKSRRDSVNYAIVTDGTLLDSGERPEGFTYEFMTGFPYETTDIIQFYGMIDVAKAPQDFKNVFYSNLLTMYMTSPKQHLIIEEGALKDTQQFLNEYSRVTGVSMVPDGFVSSGKFLQLEAPRFPPMLESLIGVVDGAVQDIFGLSSIESGTQGDLRRISGNVVGAAKAATNTLLAILFDGLRRYRKRWGVLTIKSMISYYTPPELRDIIGEDYDILGGIAFQLDHLSSWPKEVKFDIKIDESPSSISEQMETVDYLTRTGTLEKWVAAGELPFEEALDLLVTIPKSTREKIKVARNEKQKIQQQMSELQEQIQSLTQLQESFVKFIQARPGGSMILADYSLLQSMAAQLSAEKDLQEKQEAEQQGEAPEGA